MVTRAKVVMIKPQDHVAISLVNLEPGETLAITCQDQSFTVTVKEGIEFGHKFAVRDIAQGEDILKYGEVIGTALCDIPSGAHVHVHNLEGKRGRGDRQ
jgi:altronate dehydratase small subunit